MRAAGAVAGLLWMATGGGAFADTPVPSDGVIAAPGEYYLASDRVTTSGVNLDIRAGNVEVNLSGRTIRCAPPDPSSAPTFGIRSGRNDNVTIRNGAITGCYAGFSCQGAACRAVGVDFSGNTYIGFLGGGRGAQITGSLFAGIRGYSVEAYAIGISSPGTDCLIERNVFRELYRQVRASDDSNGEGIAINIGGNSSGCTIRHNWIENQAVTPEIGIRIPEGAAATVSENTITNFGQIAIDASSTSTVSGNRLWLKRPLTGSVGISGGTAPADNLIIGFDVPLDGAEPGDNFVMP